MDESECAKILDVQEESQKIGDFLEWLSERGFILCEETGNDFTDIYFPTRATTEKILAEYFEIDLDKVEAEKVSMLKELRRSHNEI